MSKVRGTLVLDAGTTNTKLCLFDAAGELIEERKIHSAVHHWEGYLAIDAEPALAFLRETLPAFDARVPVDAIVVSAHGSGLALLDENGALALPVMDYRAEPPAAIVDSYRQIAPDFEEACAPVYPMALTLGLQLFWQETMWPRAFSHVRSIVPWGQYLSYRMSGVAANEVTALGAQTQLIRPIDNSYTALMRQRGWDRLMAPIRPAFATLGPLLPKLAPVNAVGRLAVKTGVHDSNANYARYLAAGGSAFTLLSTGTWIIVFNAEGDVRTLDPRRDTTTNTDIFGRPVACARFMGGAEIEELTAGGTADAATVEAVQRLIAEGVMALPSFTNSGGPLPGTGGRGRIIGRGDLDANERASLAALYCALMVDLSLDAVGSLNPIIIDGPFSRNEPFAAVLAALRPAQQIRLSDLRDGTAAGAALLGLFERRENFPNRPLTLRSVRRTAFAGLEDYRRGWLAAATAAH